MTRDESLAQFRLAFETLHSGATGFREFRLLDPTRGKPPVIRYFGVEIKPEVIYDWISGYFGRYNCYVGRAIRATGAGDGRGGQAGDVLFATSASFDVDSRQKPATDSDLASALDQARRIQARLACGRLVLTGNGYQVWCGFKTPIDIRGRREWWALASKRLESSLVESTGGWAGDRWKVDPQYDIPRIVRLPGCPSVTANQRYARFVGDTSGLLDPERIINHADEPGDGQPLSTIPQGHVPSRFWSSLMKDRRLLEAWSGERADIRDTTGSGQDCALAARLRALRFDPSEALAILSAKPNKARSTKQYLELTIRKVYGI